MHLIRSKPCIRSGRFTLKTEDAGKLAGDKGNQRPQQKKMEKTAAAKEGLSERIGDPGEY